MLWSFHIIFPVDRFYYNVPILNVAQSFDPKKYGNMDCLVGVRKTNCTLPVIIAPQFRTRYLSDLFQYALTVWLSAIDPVC
jgi:hypothetical protein